MWSPESALFYESIYVFARIVSVTSSPYFKIKASIDRSTILKVPSRNSALDKPQDRGRETSTVKFYSQVSEANNRGDNQIEQLMYQSFLELP